ncbi:ATP-binding protein [Sorangium sp. So ce124]|uniref:ATP-binding protein n=1 Tax=Sorangium sp. So ce124 TaxID=3133280 RepID=UPI003F60B9E7
MGYLERLRSYLERVARAPEGLAVVYIDLAAHRRHFAAAWERVVASRKLSQDDTPPERWERDTWHREDELLYNMRWDLPTFVEEVADQLVESLVPDASAEELRRLIDVAIGFGIGDWDSSGARGLDEEIGRIAEAASERLKRSQQRYGWESPARYAFEIRAIRKHADRYTLTRSGATLLSLPGLDAVRWLLALEAAQSLGPADEWRISPELAAQLLKEPRREVEVEEQLDGSWPFSLATVRRLGAMKLLQYQRQDPEQGLMGWSYTVFDRARPLLEDIAEQRATPFAVLADALLRDEVALALDSVRPDPERALRESAAAATALQARMVVHEIRNALVPAQIALSRLVRELGHAMDIEPLQRHRGRVDAGIHRALAFADEMLRVANLGEEPAAPFDVSAALRDAIAGLAGELNGGLRCAPIEGAPAVVGPRGRFVLAITNVLRNSAQAVAGREGIVEVSLDVKDDEILLRVDDNGPGVPPDQRRAIFEPGVALRAGGSGQGLALVRQVIEGEMVGSVVCGESPLGGARFEIVIPLRRGRTP